MTSRALSLSVPPTPGESILKREVNAGVHAELLNRLKAEL